MSKKTVTLNLSFPFSDTVADQFLTDLQNLVEKASMDGLDVEIESGGVEFAALNSYDPNEFVAEYDIDPLDLDNVRALVRPVGICRGAYIYRRDSVAVLHMRRRGVEPVRIESRLASD